MRETAAQTRIPSNPSNPPLTCFIKALLLSSSMETKVSPHFQSLQNHTTQDSITPIATPGSNCHPTPHTLFLPQVNDVQISPPTFSEASFRAFDSSPDESKNTVLFVADDTKLLDCPPTDISPFVYIFKPAVDKSLLEPQHPPTLDGYVQAHSLPNVTILPDPSSPHNFHVPIPSDYIPPPSPSASRATSPTHCSVPDFPGPPPGFGSSGSSSDSFFTAHEYSSGPLFETSPVSAQSGIGHLKPTNESSGHMLGPHLHPPSNGQIDKGRPAAQKFSNSTLTNAIGPSSPQHQPILADGKANTFDTPSPHSASFFLFHPSVHNPPSLKGPVHDGSLLTPAIHDAVSEAAALWEATQLNSVLTSSGVSTFNLVLFTF